MHAGMVRWMNIVGLFMPDISEIPFHAYHIHN